MKILKKKWFWILLIALAIVAFFVWKKSTQGPIVIEEIGVARANLVQSISVTGSVDREQRLDLAFQAFGTIEKIYVEEGDRVSEGTLLATQEARSASAAYARANVAVTVAEKDRLQARRHWDDIKPEARDKFGLAIDSAKAARAQAAAGLSNARLTAPIDGVISKINVTEGEFAKEASVMSIADGPFIIEALVSEADIVNLFSDQEARVTFDALAQQEPLTAQIIDIAQQATVIQDVVYYEVDFSLDLGEGPYFYDVLRIGMSADVDLVLTERENTLAVPLRVVRRDTVGAYVQVRGADGTLMRRDITLGITADDGRAEIASGLSEGDVIVVVEEEKKK